MRDDFLLIITLFSFEYYSNCPMEHYHLYMILNVFFFLYIIPFYVYLICLNYNVLCTIEYEINVIYSVICAFVLLMF